MSKSGERGGRGGCGHERGCELVGGGVAAVGAVARRAGQGRSPRRSEANSALRPPQRPWSRLAQPNAARGFQEFLELFPSAHPAPRPGAPTQRSSTSRCASTTSNSSTEEAGGTDETDGSPTQNLPCGGSRRQGKPPATQAKISKPRREGPEQLPRRLQTDEAAVNEQRLTGDEGGVVTGQE